jgi:hypothetical protein
MWRDGGVFRYQSWQHEAWGFRRSLGEFNQAIDWMSRAMSRIRLTAAEIVPGGDEPEPLTEGPASQLVEDFCSGGPGHSAFLKAITPQLLVPGEGWLIAERDNPNVPLSAADWGVYSTECIQAVGDRFKVRIGEARWRDLLPDNLPMRIHEPDPQWPWLATSNAEAAVPIMRRIYLIDSRIIAMMVSRLAMNGLLLIPQEGTFSVPEQYKEAPDPFVAMLIDVAARNIANPGQASAGIPIPIRFTSELIDKWKILKAEDPLDEWLLKERTDELGRLGDTLGVARERVTGGMGAQNHWGAALASEEEVRITFAPLAETVCGAVTKAYLQPMLKAAGLSPVGPNGGRLIVWYDTSELTAKVDKSEAVVKAYDRLEANGSALRRELGLDESDKPTQDEVEEMIWKKVAGSETLAPTSVQHLSGKTDLPVAGVPASPNEAPSGGGGTSPAPIQTPTTGTPGNQPARPTAAPSSSTPVPARVASAEFALDRLAALDRRALVAAGTTLNGHRPGGRHRHPRK